MLVRCRAGYASGFDPRTASLFRRAAVPGVRRSEILKMNLSDWIEEKVTSDPRALEWFAETGSDDRIARAFRELLAGYEIDPATILKTTRPLTADEAPGLVEVRDIHFFSLCAHHFLPFFGHVDLCYEPGEVILGLGKLPRLVDAYARRFQIQEDLVRDVAREMMESGRARGVRVRSRARHLCMCSRGPSNTSSETHTEFALGSLAG